MIQENYFWTLVILMMMGTLSIRGSIIFAASRMKIPHRLRELFSYIPAAILPAFIVPSVFFHQGHVSLLFFKERFIVLFFAGLVCLWSRSTLATIVFGLLALYIVSQLS